MGVMYQVSGNITILNLAWNANGLATGDLSIAAAPTPPPAINRIFINNTNVIISGTNGVPNWPYSLLAATNLALPLGQWQPLVTNSFDSNGNFSFTNQVDPNAAQSFYRLKLQ
jgi:hypothetical protein